MIDDKVREHFFSQRCVSDSTIDHSEVSQLSCFSLATKFPNFFSTLRLGLVNDVPLLLKFVATKKHGTFLVMLAIYHQCY